MVRSTVVIVGEPESVIVAPEPMVIPAARALPVAQGINILVIIKPKIRILGTQYLIVIFYQFWKKSQLPSTKFQIIPKFQLPNDRNIY
jgi:hypothetical protein